MGVFDNVRCQQPLPWCDDYAQLVFDINGGIMAVHRWESEIVPAIVETIKRADGGWYAANVWRLKS